jgi:predicted nuclease of restriction endonuclease-like (RecB) superfamily
MADERRRSAGKALSARKRIDGGALPGGGDFESLVHVLVQVHERLAAEAVKAVNVRLTLRNWLIGCYIREYELRGSDRAAYGERLFPALATKLGALGVSNCGLRQLYRYRDFHCLYPQIMGTLSPQLRLLLPERVRRHRIVGTLFPQSNLPPEELLSQLSYSQFEELTQIENPLKRAFYEVECVRGNWSVRELKRQVVSLYFERSGLSKSKKKLAALAHAKAETSSSAPVIRDPYIFEFLGLKPKEVMSESDLEDSLLDRLQEFLLELGRGFCFEARQKRILIGGEHFFADLVFYHRILKCHLIIELKLDEFKHEYLGQLNTYVNWFRAHETVAGDNPPVGLLLCTRKNHALVEYALAGMDNQLFVSKYELQLPKKEDIRSFLEEQITGRLPETEKLGHGG